MHGRGRDSYKTNRSRANLLDWSDRTRRKKKKKKITTKAQWRKEIMETIMNQSIGRKDQKTESFANRMRKRWETIELHIDRKQQIRVTTKEENQKAYCQSKFREQKGFTVCQMVSEKRTDQSEQNGSQTVFPLTKLRFKC